MRKKQQPKLLDFFPDPKIFKNVGYRSLKTTVKDLPYQLELDGVVNCAIIVSLLAGTACPILHIFLGLANKIIAHYMSTIKYGAYNTRVLKDRKKVVDLKDKVKQLERHLTLCDKWLDKHTTDGTKSNLLRNKQQTQNEIEKLEEKIINNRNKLAEWRLSHQTQEDVLAKMDELSLKPDGVTKEYVGNMCKKFINKYEDFAVIIDDTNVDYAKQFRGICSRLKVLYELMNKKTLSATEIGQFSDLATDFASYARNEFPKSFEGMLKLHVLEAHQCFFMIWKNIFTIVFSIVKILKIPPRREKIIYFF